MKSIQLVLFFFASILYAKVGYHAEGFASGYDGDQRTFLLSIYLPYNPKIFITHSTPEIDAACLRVWPYRTLSGLVSDCDLLWLEQEKDELETLTQFPDPLATARVIYISTHLQDHGVHFRSLKEWLEMREFVMLTHWYWENRDGNAIFLKKDIYDASMRSIFHDANLHLSRLPPNHSTDLQTFFRAALNKSGDYQIDGIDFIYMINLDERPEKFALASTGLRLYGVNPYRFSAVNGWKLPTTALTKIGATFPPGTPPNQFFALTFKQVDSQECRHYEFIRDDGTSYFTSALARGPIGIVLSHLSVLQDAYDSDYQTIWVMEDDVEVVEDPNQLPQLLHTLDKLAPDWDIFFTDADTKNNTTGQRIPCRALAARPNVPVAPLTSFLDRFYPIGGGFFRTGMRYGAYSMIVRRSGMKKILDYYKTFGIFLPYDMDFWLCPNIKMFYYEKDIVSHRVGSLSDNGSPAYQNK